MFRSENTPLKLRVLQIGDFLIFFLTENYLALSDDLILKISKLVKSLLTLIVPPLLSLFLFVCSKTLGTFVEF